MKGDDIAGRLLRFAVGVLEVVGELPQTYAGKHVSRQLTRSSTSGGANYEEARCAESRADFAYKCNVAGKELRESVYWLKILDEGGLSRSPRLASLVQEGNELTAILKASAKTAKARAG